jgi:hypothetical protein
MTVKKLKNEKEAFEDDIMKRGNEGRFWYDCEKTEEWEESFWRWYEAW